MNGQCEEEEEEESGPVAFSMSEQFSSAAWELCTELKMVCNAESSAVLCGHNITLGNKVMSFDASKGI